MYGYEQDEIWKYSVSEQSGNHANILYIGQYTPRNELLVHHEHREGSPREAVESVGAGAVGEPWRNRILCIILSNFFAKVIFLYIS